MFIAANQRNGGSAWLTSWPFGASATKYKFITKTRRHKDDHKYLRVFVVKTQSRSQNDGIGSKFPGRRDQFGLRCHQW